MKRKRRIKRRIIVGQFITKNKRLIIITELIILLLLVLLTISKSKNPTEIAVNLGEFKSDYLIATSDSITVDEKLVATEIEGKDSIFLASSPPVQLRPGSYTITIKYKADKKQTCTIKSGESSFLYAQPFYLNRNVNECTYDFYITQSTDNLELQLPEYTGGNLEIYDVSIASNINNLKIILFITLLFFIILDCVLFVPQIRQNKALIIAIIGIAGLASLPIFMKGIALGHDHRFHLARIESIANGIAAGNIPVKMHSFLVEGYGYPVGVFYGDLLLYIPAALRLIGFSITTTYKIYLLTVNLLTTVSAYYCGRKIFEKRSTAILFSLAYVTASYKFVTMFVRSAVGEYTSFIFYPLILMALWDMYTNDPESEDYYKNSYYLAAGMIGLLYTHVLSTEMSMIGLIMVAIVFIRKTLRKKTLAVYGKAVVLSAVIGSAFWIPFIDYYIRSDIVIKNKVSGSPSLIQNTGAYISDYFAFFRDFYGANSEIVTRRMQISPGPLLMLVLLAAITVIALTRKPNRKMNCMTLFSVGFLIISSNLFPWNMLAQSTGIGNFMAQVQFPWRYLGFAVLCLSLLMGIILEDETVVEFGGNWICPLIVVICIFSACFFVSNCEDSAEPSVHIDEADFYEEAPAGLGQGREYAIPHTDFGLLDNNVVSNNADAVIIAEKDINLSVDITNSGNDAYIDIPRFAYPCYKATTDKGEVLKTETGDNNRLRISLPNNYKGIVEIRFTEPWYWRLAEIISLVAVIVLSVATLKRRKLAQC